jgi:hypothetical protein
MSFWAPWDSGSDLSPEDQTLLAELVEHQQLTEGVPPLKLSYGQGSEICALTLFLAEQKLDNPIGKLRVLSNTEQAEKVRAALEELEEIEFTANYANLGDDELQMRFMGAIMKVAETDVNRAHELAQIVLDQG